MRCIIPSCVTVLLALSVGIADAQLIIAHRCQHGCHMGATDHNLTTGSKTEIQVMRL